MARWTRSGIALLFLLLACDTGSGGGSPQILHPQPQPNRGASFIAPCNASTCGPAPDVASPRCKEEATACTWSDDTSVSYRPCADTECGEAPTGAICPVGTTFRGNSCGAENEGACLWRTTCAPPPSTTPCTTTDGCGPMPLIGVVCSDGGTGGLSCMQFDGYCRWQRTCD